MSKIVLRTSHHCWEQCRCMNQGCSRSSRFCLVHNGRMCTGWKQGSLPGLALPCSGREPSMCPTSASQPPAVPAVALPMFPLFLFQLLQLLLPTPGDHSLCFSTQPPVAIPHFVLNTFPWRRFSAWVPRTSLFQSRSSANFSTWLGEASVLLRDNSVKTHSACCPLLPAAGSLAASSLLPPLLVTPHTLLPAHPYFWLFPLDFYCWEWKWKLFSMKPKRPSQCKVTLDCTHP